MGFPAYCADAPLGRSAEDSAQRGGMRAVLSLRVPTGLEDRDDLIDVIAVARRRAKVEGDEKLETKLIRDRISI